MPMPRRSLCVNIAVHEVTCDMNSSQRGSEEAPTTPLTPRKRSPDGDFVYRTRSSVKKRAPQDDGFLRIRSSDILKRAMLLFPVADSDMDVTKMPCLSARLFACFTLVMLGHDSRRTHIIRKVQPLLPLMKAWVFVELTSMGPAESSRKAAPRGVHFSSYDCSSVMPAIDSIAGSHRHTEDCISALTAAAREIETIVSIGDDYENMELVDCLQHLIRFLARMGPGSPLAFECAKSICNGFPQSRLVSASEHYHHDLELLLTRITTGKRNKPLYIETRFADLVGQTLRYYLRKAFNPSATEEQNDPPLFVALSDKLHNAGKGEGHESALEDGCVSAIFSSALRRIHEYFDVGVIMSLEDVRKLTFRGVLCESEPSQQGITRNATSLSKEDLQLVLKDVDEAMSFLHASQACCFLASLVNVPGVLHEIQTSVAWARITRLASLMQTYSLSSLCPNDAHFVALAQFGTFMKKVEFLSPVMKNMVPVCEKNLKAVATRFKTNAKRFRLKKRYPEVKIIAEALEEGRQRYQPLPIVKY